MAKFVYERKHGFQEVFYQDDFLGYIETKVSGRWQARTPYGEPVTGFLNKTAASEWLLEQYE